MRKILYILCTLFPLLACSRTELDRPLPREVLPEPDSAIGVLVKFNVSIPELTPQTKALGDTPAGDLDNLYIAVFGRSGYLKEYVEATITKATTNGKVGETTNRYTISAILTLSENSERHIHFIGNGPSSLQYGQETELIPNLLSPAGQGGYWQYFVVPGIKAKRGAYDENNNWDPDKYVIEDGHYVLSEETAAYFSDVPLIRNYSKIVVEDMDGCHFTTKSFAAVNVATQGSMAPYYSGGFVPDYQLKSYTDLRNTLQYPALLPLDVTFNSSVPSASSFTSNPVGAGVAAAGGSFFMYERPIPDDDQKPTSVVIYGHFTDPDLSDGNDSGDYYYKVDLMDDEGYYPIYRNFKYRIQIEEILRPGSASPEDALRTMGSGDISADVATQSLTDISDGTSHILVSYMSKTLIRQYPYTDGNETVHLTLKYKYIPDVTKDTNNDGEADWNNNLVANGGPVSISLQNIADETDRIISSYTVAGSDDTDGSGFRTITITTSAPSNYLRSQYLRISGTYTRTVDGKTKTTTLYRNVTYSMINTQIMTVSCTPSRVQTSPGQPLRVDITIPKDLPPSMFPLVFYLEAEKLSLTPDNSHANNNLPVYSGLSISGSGKTAFHFIRTVSEDEYLQLSAATSATSVSIPCYFKTNMAESASTIYVVDEEGFFQPANTQFRNYGTAKTFTGLNFPSGVPKTINSQLPFTFAMDDQDDLPEKVYLKFTNVKPTSNSGLSLITDSTDPHYGWYWYSPAGTTNTDLKNKYVPTVRLATTNTTGIAEVWIEAEEYNPAYIKYEIPATGISISPNATQDLILRVPGRNTVDLTATVTPANSTDGVTWTSSSPGVATVDANGHVVAVSAGSTTITARANNSVSATVTVNVSTLKFSNLNFYNAANGTQITSVGFGNNKDVYFRFDYESGFSGASYPVTFTLGNLDTADARLVSNGNGTYTFTPTDNNVTQYVHLKTTTRYSAGTVRIAHDYYDATDTKTINRSLFVPAGTLKARGYYIDQSGVEHADENPTKLTVNDNSNGTGVTLSASKDGASAGTVYFNTGFLNRNDSEDTNNRFSSPSDGTVVYAKYTVSNNSYYGTVTLGAILTAIENNTYTPINLYRWATGSYSIDFTSRQNNNYSTNDFTDGTSKIRLQFSNCPGQADAGFNRRKDIGTDNASGTIAINAGNTQTGCYYLVSGITFTYFQTTVLFWTTTYNQQSVTINNSTLPGGDNDSWTSTNTGIAKNGETWTGETPVTVTMGAGNPHNAITNISLNYGFFEY